MSKRNQQTGIARGSAHDALENSFKILEELKEMETERPPPLKKIFTTQQFCQLPSNLLSGSDKQVLQKCTTKYNLKRLSGQLRKNVEYCVRLKLFKSFCFFKVCEEQPKNFNILHLELIEVVPYSKITNMDILMSLVDSPNRVIIN
jgi:hypothetical protein